MDDNRVLIDEQNLYDIADAIRRQNGETTKYLPEEMPPAIDALNVDTDAVRFIYLDTAEWGDIYEKLSPIEQQTPVLFYASAAVSALLTDGHVNSTLKGVINHGTTTYDCYAMVGAGSGSGNFLTWRISGLTADGATIGVVSKYVAVSDTNATDARRAVKTCYALTYSQSGNAFTFDVPVNCRAVIILSASVVAYNAVYIVIATGAQAVTAIPVLAGSYTVDTSVTGEITFSTPSNISCNMLSLSLKQAETSIPTLQ